MIPRETIQGAVVQAYCKPQCEDKVMDPILVEAIIDNVMAAINKYEGTA